MTDGIDKAYLETMRSTYGDENFRRLRQIFLDEMHGRLAELTCAVSEIDTDTVRRIAHRMVSLLGSFGARPLAEKAREVASCEDRLLVLDLARAFVASAHAANNAVIEMK
jgi:HPt (histidine-containing phosphotransfer) domain-containing protein